MTQIRGDLNVTRRIEAGLAINAPQWQSGKDYIADDMFLHNGELYVVVTGHTSTTSPMADVVNLNRFEMQSNVKRIATAQVDLQPGVYDLDSSGGAFSISLPDVVGKWEFHNSNMSLGTNAVTISSAGGKSFTNAAGVQVNADLVLNVPAKPVAILHTELGVNYRVSLDPASSVVKAIEVLTIVSRNTVNPLAFTPLSPVEFSLNGVATNGITNAGTVVSVDPVVVGNNIDPVVDRLTATYLR